MVHSLTMAFCVLQIWCALSMINEISSKRAMLHFLHLGGRLWLAIIACQSCWVSRLLKLLIVEDSWCTGTLKSCQQAAIDYNKRLLDGLRLTQQVLVTGCSCADQCIHEPCLCNTKPATMCLPCSASRCAEWHSGICQVSSMSAINQHRMIHFDLPLMLQGLLLTSSGVVFVKLIGMLLQQSKTIQQAEAKLGNLELWSWWASQYAEGHTCTTSTGCLHGSATCKSTNTLCNGQQSQH